MATIRLEDVTKIYLGSRGEDEGTGSVVALDHVNLTIPDGQTLAVIGPTGCGKSTLLHVIAGLEDYAGRIFYDDQDMESISPGDRYIGMVFQNYALYPHFMSRGNLEFFFRVRRRPDEEAEERIRITSEIMGIGFKELLPRKPGTLSGGQRQRVAIARALVRKPRLFLFDEPLSNLDAKLRVRTRGEIKRLLHLFDITAVYTTHDQVEAISLGDQIAVLRAGRIEQVGTYHDLRERPVNAFVAGFLGSPGSPPMNLFTGGTVSDGALRLGEATVPLPGDVRDQVHAGQALILGVRPETARLAVGKQPSPDGVRLRGIVEIVEPDFAHRQQVVYVRTREFSYAVIGPLDVLLNVGDEVEAAFPIGHLFFFDGESERRL